MSLDDDTKRLSDLIDSVADGRSVDWDAAGAAPDDERMRRLLEVLRIVDGVAGVHRTELAVSEAHERRRVARGASEATTVEAGEAVTNVANLRWGHFELLRKLGEGTFGEVYHARDTWLDHPVALKLLKPIVDRERFLREARTLARIRHDNVVRIHGADEHNGRLGFWMDFVEGPTLADVVAKEGVRSPIEAAVIGQALCSAMAAVHATKIVHRDIKAQNVIRHTQTGHIILMDFGAGEAMDADDEHRNPTGTPLYLAPELFDGRVATPETDIYALGVLLFHVVTRSYPVQGERMKDLRAAHRRGERHHLGDMRPDLPDPFVRAVERMLDPDPTKRFHSATEARKALDEVVAPSDVSPPIPAPQRVATPWYRIYTSLLVAFGIAVFLTVNGFLTTSAMAVTFGRGEFGVGSPFAGFEHDGWFVWGWSLMVAPIRYIGEYTLELLGVIVLVRVLRRLVASIDDGLTRAGANCRRFLERHRLDEPNLLLQATACLGALAFAGLGLYRWEEANAFTMFIETAPGDRLAMLQPANAPQFDVLSRLLEKILFTYGVAVAIVYYGVRQPKVRVTPGTKAYVLGVALAAFLLFRVIPFRIVYQNEFPRVDYGNTRCYDLGRAGGLVRLFCPDQDPDVSPRMMTKEESDRNLHARGVTESIFTPHERARVFDIASP